MAKDKNYFNQDTEEHLKLFLKTEETETKNFIYREFLKDPFNKLIENIIRTYKLYPDGIDYELLHMETLSFLATKFDKFKGDKGKKGYSYFGTVIKHHLINEVRKSKQKKISNKVVSYEDVRSNLINRDDMVYEIDTEEVTISLFEIIECITEDLKKKSMNENDIKVGNGIKIILQNYDILFNGNINSKYNKNVIFSYLREITLLNTKDIRPSLKKFKKMYTILKKSKF